MMRSEALIKLNKKLDTGEGDPFTCVDIGQCASACLLNGNIVLLPEMYVIKTNGRYVCTIAYIRHEACFNTHVLASFASLGCCTYVHKIRNMF